MIYDHIIIKLKTIEWSFNPLRYIKADFHCHSIYSSDSLSEIRALIHRAKDSGLGKLILTDHNTIRGALIAKEIDPEYVIVGEEILTSDGGEILAVFVSEEVPEGLSAMETIERLQKQGAFITLSHPFDWFRVKWKPDMLEQLVPFLDAVEVFNGRVFSNQFNLKAQAFAEKHGLGQIVGSDAHSLSEIGETYLILPEFSDAQSLRRALPDAIPQKYVFPAWIHLLSTYASLKKKLFRIKP